MKWMNMKGEQMKKKHFKSKYHQEKLNAVEEGETDKEN